MIRFSNAPSGRHFLQIPGPTNVPDRILRAIDHPTIDHRGPEFGALGRKVLSEIKTVFKTSAGRGDLPRLRHRRLGGGPGQHAVGGRPGADVRDRAFRLAMARAGRAARPPGRLRRRRLAPWRRSGRRRGAAGRGPRPRHQGGHGRAQRDLDRRHQPHRCHPAGDRCGRASGAVHGRYDFLARLDRLPPRRMGRRRHRGRLAEGPDAAAGPVVQRDQRQGAGEPRDGAAAPQLLGLGADAGRQQDRLFSLHAGDQPALRPARGPRDADGGGARQRLRPARPPCRGDAQGRAGLGARDPLRRTRRNIRAP